MSLSCSSTAGGSGFSVAVDLLGQVVLEADVDFLGVRGALEQAGQHVEALVLGDLRERLVLGGGARLARDGRHKVFVGGADGGLAVVDDVEIARRRGIGHGCGFQHLGHILAVRPAAGSGAVGGRIGRGFGLRLARGGAGAQQAHRGNGHGADGGALQQVPSRNIGHGSSLVFPMGSSPAHLISILYINYYTPCD